MRIADLLDRSRHDYPDHLAVSVVGGPSWTYAELHDRVRRIGSGMVAMGVAPGDRVAVVATNGITFHDIYLACSLIGAIAVPLNSTLALPEAEYILHHADPTLVVVDGPYGALAEQAPASIPILDVEADDYGGLLNHEIVESSVGRGRPDDIGLIIYTSGTTGRPKGVCLTQAALAFNGLTIALSQKLDHDDVFLSCTPLYHAASGTRVFTMLLDGQTHVILPSFDTEVFLRSMAEFGVTTTVVVPTQLQRMLDSPLRDSVNLDALRLLVYGAAPSSLPLIERATREMTCGLHQGYGLTEAVSNLTALTAADHRLGDPNLLRSCGRPVPGSWLRLLDSEGRPSARGDVGEIVVRSDKVMAGYWRDEEATRKAIVDGWLHTGDLAQVDESGYLYIAGRAKDMLISGGVNVYPSEIEEVVCAHPAVEAAAVVGIPHPEWGEVPVAFVTIRAGMTVDAGEIEAWCEGRLSRIKIPRWAVLVPAMPRTSTGKVRKNELQDFAQTLDSRPGGPPLSAELEVEAG